jgi:hypothetical protein
MDQKRGTRAAQATISTLNLGKARIRRKPERAARERLKSLMIAEDHPPILTMG